MFDMFFFDQEFFFVTKSFLTLFARISLEKILRYNFGLKIFFP